MTLVSGGGFLPSDNLNEIIFSIAHLLQVHLGQSYPKHADFCYHLSQVKSHHFVNLEKIFWSESFSNFISLRLFINDIYYNLSMYLFFPVLLVLMVLSNE